MRNPIPAISVQSRFPDHLICSHIWEFILETQHLRAPSVQKTLEILKPCRDIQEFILVRNPIPAPSVQSRFPDHLVCLSYLRSHLRVHIGDTTFACSVCTKIFGDSQQLQRHLRVHTGEKPHTCPHCTKSFTRSSNLGSHLRTHSGKNHTSA